MTNEYVIKLAADYLKRHLARKQPASLLGMIHEIDYINRTIPRFEEINAALKQCPSMYVRRVAGQVEFVPKGRGRKITFEDMERAYVKYRESLDAASERLRDDG